VTTRCLSLLLALPLALAVGLTGTAHAQSAPATFASEAPAAEASAAEAPLLDRQAVRQAALDYVEAIYEVDSTRIVRSVHPELVKHGYYSRNGTYRGAPMTYDELKQLAATWNRDPQRVHPDSARKHVAVFEVLDKTASAKVVAHWGTDYMHLAKIDGRWQIQQILWQSHPPSE
jgi:hypothetical protein